MDHTNGSLPDKLTLELARLTRVESEYNALTRVFAVVVEQLLTLTGGDAVEVTDEAMREAGGTKAWRDASRDVVLITVV